MDLKLMMMMMMMMMMVLVLVKHSSINKKILYLVPFGSFNDWGSFTLQFSKLDLF